MDNPAKHKALSLYNEVTAFNPGQHNSAGELTAMFGKSCCGVCPWKSSGEDKYNLKCYNIAYQKLSNDLKSIVFFSVILFCKQKPTSSSQHQHCSKGTHWHCPVGLCW